jgi:uncharacterized protein (DUF2236 family)
MAAKRSQQTVEPIINNHIGYFGPDSLSWQLYREPAVLLGGFRALLLQIAHPAVADGVARYSNFRQDALGRGYRTFRAMATIYFGTCQQADGTAARLKRIHSGIRGSDYVATDQLLQLWVWATLIDTTFVVFTPLQEHLKLPIDWQEKFYAESQRAATILGIESSQIPTDLRAFKQYFTQILQREGILGSQPISTDLAQSIVFHRLVPQPLGRLLAIGWLPDWLCERLQLQVIPHDRQRFERTTLPRLYRVLLVLPRFIRYAPAWHQGRYRIALAEGRPRPLWGRLLWWLGQRWELPLGIPASSILVAIYFCIKSGISSML